MLPRTGCRCAGRSRAQPGAHSTLTPMLSLLARSMRRHSGVSNAGDPSEGGACGPPGGGSAAMAPRRATRGFTPLPGALRAPGGA